MNKIFLFFLDFAKNKKISSKRRRYKIRRYVKHMTQFILNFNAVLKFALSKKKKNVNINDEFNHNGFIIEYKNKSGR